MSVRSPVRRVVRPVALTPMARALAGAVAVIPPPQTGPVLLADDFVGAAAQQVYQRAGWAEAGLTAQRARFVIAAGGREMQMVGSGADGYGIYRDTATADHWSEVTLGAGVATTWWVGARLQSPYVSGNVYTDGVKVYVWGANGIQIQPRSAAADGTIVSLHSGNCPAGTFPLYQGDVLRAEWVASTKVLRLYKNNALIYTSAALTVAAPGTLSGFSSGISGYAGAFRVADSSTANSCEPNHVGLVVCRDPGQSSRALRISGTYAGSAPSGIQYRVLTTAGVVAGLDWQALSGAAIAAGAWSGTTGPIPAGAGPYWIETRKADAQAITGKTRRFGVGIVAALYGQSNAANQQSTATTTTVTPAANAYISIAQGAQQVANRAPQEWANRIAAATGLPALVICDGLGGQPIANLKPGSATWTSFEAHLASYGTQLEAVNYWQGESDAGGNMTTWQSDLSSMRTRLLTLTGRAASDIKWLLTTLARNTNISPNSGQAAIDWQAVRDAQAAWCAANGEVIGAHAAAEPQADFLHLTGEGYLSVAQRVARSHLKLLGLAATDGRGPIPASAAHTNGTATVTVSFDLNGCTGLAAGTGLTGWEVSADDFSTLLTISDASVSGDTVVITLSATAGAVKVRHLWGANPPVTNVVKGTGLGLTYDVPAAPRVLTAA